jgi:putative ABC transport system permease protein
MAQALQKYRHLKPIIMTLLSGLLVATRRLAKNKLSSVINIAGLAIGITGFACIMLYVEHESNFDRFHGRYPDTYRVVKDFVTSEGLAVPDATSPPALAKALRTGSVDVETATRFVPNRGRLYLLQSGDKRFYETELLRVDKEFFNVFDFEFIAGNKDKALEQIHSIILTRSTALKYFGDEDPIGKTIRMNVNNGTDYQVTGIVNDVPSQSHFSFNVIIPFESRRDPDTNWQFSGFYTYVRLKPGSDPAALTSMVKDLVKTHHPNSLDRYFVQPLADIHLHSHLKWELMPNGNITYLKILTLIGIFILTIACINYINLVTARSSERAREVGIRKTVGAVRRQLIYQFISESVFTVSIAVGLAFIIISVVLPALTPITGVDLSASWLESDVVRWSIPFSLLIALLAGAYPAFYLSRFQPLKTIRGSFSTGQKKSSLRKALVVFQFAMSSALIVGTLVITDQLHFMKQKDIGFNKDNVLLVPNVRSGIGLQSTLSGPWDERVKQIPGVVNISRADGIIGSNNQVNGVSYSPKNSRIGLNFIRIDYEFLPTLEIKLASGRNFSPEFQSDSSAIILNEEAIEQLGMEEPVIGQTITWDDEVGKTHDVTIVGVVKNFHFNDMHTAITPFGFILEVGNGSNFFIRTAPGNLQNTLARIEQVWNNYNPGKPFEYSFQDQYIASFVINDERFEDTFKVFTGIAIVIAAMGLFGLTIFMAESRTKEIGIRKILGGSVINILKLLSKEYVITILISLVIAFPFAYFLMEAWLQNFVYHIDIGWTIFGWAALISIALALATVSFHAIKVATRNPVHSLRSE